MTRVKLRVPVTPWSYFISLTTYWYPGDHIGRGNIRSAIFYDIRSSRPYCIKWRHVGHDGWHHNMMSLLSLLWKNCTKSQGNKTSKRLFLTLWRHIRSAILDLITPCRPWYMIHHVWNRAWQCSCDCFYPCNSGHAWRKRRTCNRENKGYPWKWLKNCSWIVRMTLRIHTKHTHPK